MFKLINYNFKTNINLIVLIWCVTKLICVSTNHIVSNSSINETNVLNDIGNVPTENVLENQIPADNANGDDKLPVQVNAGMRTKRMLNVDNGIPLLMYTHHNDPSNKYKRCRNRNHQPYEHNPRLPLDNKLISMHHPPLPHLTHTTTPCNCPLNQYNGFGKCYCGKPTCDCKRRKKFPKLTPENINYIYNLLHNKYHHPKQEIDKMFRIAKDNPGITTEKLLQSIHSVTTEKVAKTNGFIRPDLEVISTPGITMKEVEIPRYHSPLDITTNQVPKKFPEDGIYILEEKQSDLDFISTNFAPEGNTESISYFNQRGVAEPTEDFYDTEISIEETSPLVLQLESNLEEEPFNTLRPKPLKNYLHFSEKAVASSESESDEVIQRDEDVLVTQDMISDVRRLRQKENEFTRMLSVKHKAPLEKIVVLDKLQPLKKPISNNVMLIDRANTRLEKPPEVPLDPILVQQKNGFNFDGVEEVTELEKKYKAVTGVQRKPGSMGLAPTLINRINQDGTMTDFIKFLSTKQGVTKMLLPPQEVSTPNLLQPTIGKPIYPTKIPPQKSPILSLASTKIQKIPAIPPASESTCGSVTTNNIETIRKQITQHASPPVSPNILDISTEPTVFCTCHKMINGEVFPINNGEAFIPNFPLPTQALEALSNQYKDIVAQIENGIIKDDDDLDPDLAKDIDLLIDKEIKKILDADCCSQCKQVDQAQRASFEILDPDTKLETIPTKYEDSNEPLNLSFLEDDSRPFTYEYVSEESPILGEISKLDRISTEIEKKTQNLEVQTQGIEKTISNLEDVGDEFSYEYVTEEVSSREARHSGEDVAPDPLEEISTPRENLDEFTYEYVTEEESSSEKLQNPPPEIEVATGSKLPGFGVKEEEVKPLVTENIQKPVQEPRISSEELQIPHPEIEKMETDSKLPGFVVKSEEIKPAIEEIKNIQEPVQEPTMNPEILQIHHPEIEGMEIAPKLSGFNEIENIQNPLQEPRMDSENLQNPLLLPGVMAKPEEIQLSIQEMENIHKPLQETGVVEDEFTYEYVTEEETSQENPKIINEVKPKLAQELEVSPVPEPEDEFTYEYVTEEELSQENSELSPVVSLPEPTQNTLLNQKFVQQEAIPQIRPIADPKPFPDLMGEIKANIPTPIEILDEFTENSQLTPVVSLSEPTQNVLPNKEFVHQEEIPQYHPEQLGTPIADPKPLPDLISEIKEAISTPQEVLDEFTYEYVTEEVSGEENLPEIQEVQKQELDPVLIKTEKGIIPTTVDEQTTQIIIENDQIPNSEYLPNQELGAISEIIPEIPELVSSFHNNNSEKNLEENVESVTPKYPEVTETTYTVPELISNFHNRYPEIIPEIELPPNDPTLLESQNPYFPPIPEEIPQPNLEPEIDLDLMGSSSTEVQHIELAPETLTITPENNTEIHLEMEHSPILTAINYGISHKVIEPDLTHFPDYPDITTEVLNGHIEKSSHNPIIQALNYNFEHMLDPSEIHYVPDTNNEDYSYESSEENDIPVLEKVPDDSRKLEEVKLDNSMERNNPEVIVEDPDEVLQVEATESHETIVNPDSPDDFTYEYITVEATSNETQTNPLPLPEIIPETKTKIVDLLGAKIGLSNSLPVEDYSYEYVTIESSSNENNKKSMEDLEADSTEVQYETLNQIQEIQESNKVATEIESPEETSSDLTSSSSERKIQTIPGHIYEITSQITDVKNKNNVPAFIPGTIHITSSDIPEHMRNRITEKMINACQVSANDCQVDHNHNSKNEILTSLWEDSSNEDSIPLTVKRESTETPEEEWNPRTSLPLPEETIESLEKEIKPSEINQKWSPRKSDSTIKIEPTEISQDLDESSSRIHPVFQPRPKYITEYESYEVTSEETTEIIHPHTPIPPMDPKLVTTLRSVFGSGKIVTERPNNKKFLNGQLYFVSNTGIRIPLKITRNNQGSLQLTLDVTKVCPNHCPVPCNCKCDSSSSYESDSYESYSGSDESQYSGSDESEEFYYKRNPLSRKLDTMLPRLKRVPREIGASPLEITTLMEKNSFIRNHFAHLKQKGDIGRFNRHLDHQRVTLPQPMTTAETRSTTADVEETTPEVSNMVENVNFREVSPDWKGGTTTSSPIVTEPSVNEMSSESNQIEHYFHRGHHRRLPIRSHLPVDPIWTDESAQAEEDLQDDAKSSKEVSKPHEELTNLDSQTLNNPWTLKSSEKPEVLQDNMKLQEHRVLFGNIQLQNEEIDDEIFSRHRKDHHRISANAQSFSEYPTPQNFIPYQPYDSLESLMTQLRQDNHFLDDGPKDLPTQKNFHQVSPDWKGGTYPNHHEHEMNENQLFFHKNNDLHENLLHKERHHQFPSLEPLTKFDQNVVPKNDNFRVQLPLQSNENQQFYDAIMDYLIMESARIPEVKEKSSEDIEVLKRRLAIYEHLYGSPKPIDAGQYTSEESYKHKKKHRKRKHRKSEESVEEVKKPEPKEEKKEDDRKSVSTEMFEERIACDQFVNKRMGLVRSVFNWVRDWVTETAVKTKQAITSTAAS